MQFGVYTWKAEGGVNADRLLYYTQSKSLKGRCYILLKPVSLILQISNKEKVSHIYDLIRHCLKMLPTLYTNYQWNIFDVFRIDALF